MKVSILLTLAAAIIAGASTVPTPSEVEVSASFPESNQFGHVINGEKNIINVLLENKSDSEVDSAAVSGSFENPDTGKLLRNTTKYTHNGQILPGTKLSIPYSFHSEFKPQDVRLQIFVEYKHAGKAHFAHAYNSIVSVVEPPASIFDLTLIITYLFIIAIFGGAAYLIIAKYFPRYLYTVLSFRKPKPKRNSSAPAGTTKTTGYEEQWIPRHLLKSRTTKTRSNAPVSSGDESGNTSGGGKRKGKKRT